MRWTARFPGVVRWLAFPQRQASGAGAPGTALTLLECGAPLFDLPPQGAAAQK